MGASIEISISPEGLGVLNHHKDREKRLRENVSDAVQRSLVDVENYIKSEELRGGDPMAHRGGALPLAVRSGGLISSLSHAMVGLYSGYVGVVNGPAMKYAMTVLGAMATTIAPVKAKHLWVPTADNLNASGQMKISPAEAMGYTDSSGKRLLQIFFDKKLGGLVAFLPATVSGGGVKPASGKYTRGAKKGQQRGMLLFILKDTVTVQGSDALGKAIEARHDVIQGNLQAAADSAMQGPGSDGAAHEVSGGQS